MNSKLNKFKYLAIACIALAGCNGGGGSSGGSNNEQPNDNSGTGNAENLSITTPSTLASTSKATTGYVVVANPTTGTISKISYAISKVSGNGNNVTVDSTSAANCASVTAGSSCNLKVNVPSGTIAGSFKVVASTNNTQASKLKSTQAASTDTSPLVGVGQVTYTTTKGADGIALNYANTVVAGVAQVLVTGIVTSTLVGDFNTVELVDAAGAPISGQQAVSDDLGAGKPTLTQGDTFSIMLPVISGTQNFYVKTSFVAADGSVTPGSTSNTSYSLTTTSGVGILGMLPSKVYLTPTYSEQEIELYNDGEAELTLNKLTTGTNLSYSGYSDGDKLKPGEHKTIKVKLINSSVPSSNGGIYIDYNDGQTDGNQEGAEVDENIVPEGDNEDNHDITPATGGNIVAELEPNANFFTTTTTGVVMRQMSIKNKGSSTASGISITLPANFTISSGFGEDVNENCTISSASGANPVTISNTLTGKNSGSENGNECKVMVTYTNSVATTQTIGLITFNYNAMSSTVGVVYRVN